jgi:peptidoglycan biosynthesis protein MviN/MurJ (putative lipid II flippase)
MVDYQKFCLLAFKVLGIVLVSYGIITLLVSLIFYISAILSNPKVKLNGIEFSMFVQIITGLLLFFLSEKLTSIVFEYPKKNDKE